jgi:hypothetical protein
LLALLLLIFVIPSVKDWASEQWMDPLNERWNWLCVAPLREQRPIKRQDGANDWFFTRQGSESIVGPPRPMSLNKGHSPPSSPVLSLCSFLFSFPKRLRKGMEEKDKERGLVGLMEGEFTIRWDPWAGLIASCGSF